MKIYVVIGETGEYSGRIEWFVCAYKEEELSEKHANLAHEYAKKWREHGCDPRPIGDYTFESPYDSNAKMDYIGTEYRVEEVELREELPE